MTGWWLALTSRVELADTAVTNARENERLRKENAAAKTWIRTLMRDLSLALEMSDNEIAIRRTLMGLHRIDLAPEAVEPK